jgi:LmbE family N-acetylglucosaminyl deacetylase
MRVLIIAPHPDDESIGCGGAAALHRERGDEVDAVFLTSGELGLRHLPADQARSVREAEARAAAVVLGLRRTAFLRLPDWGCADAIEQGAALLGPLLSPEAGEESGPGLIYVPHPDEDHPDHAAAIAMVRAALASRRPAAPWVLGYEVWTPLSRFDHVEDISPAMDRKLAAVRCHQSQLSSFRYDEAVAGLNRYRGELAARSRFAEVFLTLDAG